MGSKIIQTNLPVYRLTGIYTMERIKHTITITLEGETDSDIEFAFQEAAKLICEGYVEGLNSNETGEFYFHIKKELNEIVN
jgi:hypothetical protein